MTEHSASKPLPLAGIRVLDFSWVVAGPLIGRFLADFGAEVIKIETETHLDDARIVGHYPPGHADINLCSTYHEVNVNKLGVTLNLRTEEGRELARRLVQRSDIVTNNFTGEVMPRLGLAYEDLVKLKPDLIYLSMPMMGMTGPYRHWGGTGGHIAAVSGLNHISGYPERLPIGLGNPYPDASSNPMHALIAILTALFHRKRTGQGQYIDLSQVESTVQLLGPTVLEYLATGNDPGRNGNKHRWAAPHEVYPCEGEDRWCAISVFSDAQWTALCEVLGAPGLATEESFATFAARKRNESALDARLAGLTRRWDAYALMVALQKRDVPAGVVQSVRDLLEYDATARDRIYARVQHSSGYDLLIHRMPERLEGLEPEIRIAPDMGQDNGYVFGTLLGLSDDEIAKPAMRGAFK